MESNIWKACEIVIWKRQYDGKGEKTAGEDARNREKIVEGSDWEPEQKNSS